MKERITVENTTMDTKEDLLNSVLQVFSYDRSRAPRSSWHASLNYIDRPVLGRLGLHLSFISCSSRTIPVGKSGCLTQPGLG